MQPTEPEEGAALARAREREAAPQDPQAERVRARRQVVEEPRLEGREPDRGPRLVAASVLLALLALLVWLVYAWLA
jgi:hypothetical protein